MCLLFVYSQCVYCLFIVNVFIFCLSSVYSLVLRVSRVMLRTPTELRGSWWHSWRKRTGLQLWMNEWMNELVAHLEKKNRSAAVNEWMNELVAQLEEMAQVCCEWMNEWAGVTAGGEEQVCCEWMNDWMNEGIFVYRLFRLRSEIIEL